MARVVTRNSRCLAMALIILLTTGFSQQPGSPPVPPSGTEGAKASAPQTQPAPALRVSTRLVLIDVVALDHKGLPVADLKAEDFTLREEGADQKVRVFSFQQPSAGEATPGVPAAQPVKIPATMFTNVPTYKANRTLSVILLDGLNTDLASQKYARQEMIKSLAKLPAGQPVAVYAWASSCGCSRISPPIPACSSRLCWPARGMLRRSWTTPPLARVPPTSPGLWPAP
jgi:hypothetical protein